MFQNARLPLDKVAARTAQTVALFAILGAVLFLAAGRLDWWEAWILLGLYFVIAEAGALWTLYRDPALSEERSKIGKNAKGWDQVLVGLNLLLTVFLWLVIGLDAGRFNWSEPPLWARILAGLGLLLSFSLTVWASRVNTYLSGVVRIQAERGHHAVTGGPYRYIRHPMYASMIIYDVCLPLLFGSAWALLVSGLMIATILVRTAKEDRTLQAELPGYAEFTRQTRYRLLPGIW